MVLQTSDDGLNATEAAQRLREDGPNALPGDQQRNLWAIARDTLAEPMFLLLLAAGCSMSFWVTCRRG